MIAPHRPVGARTMHRACRQAARRGFTLVPAIAMLGLILLLVAVAARHTVHVANVERAREDAAWVWRIAHSARCWVELHGESLGEEPVELPLAELLPPHYNGSVHVRRVVRDDGTPGSECALRLERGRNRFDKTIALD